MSLLHEIQASVLKEDSDLGPILLKLRLLAARLGSQSLAEWVKYESEGYPKGVEVPAYRVTSVSYTATFSGPFGSGIQNAPISPYLIETLAGESWVKYEVRGSIAALDDLVASSEKGGTLQIEASNLIHLLQGNVYEDYVCNSVTGKVSRSAMAAIRHSVRSRVLELTIELEKSIPEAATVALGPAATPAIQHSAAATQIAQQIIYGNVTSITATGDAAKITINIGKHDAQALTKFLESSGMPEVDADELVRLAAAEAPESSSEPMGPNVRNWLVENLKKAANGTWKMGVTVATDLIKEALLKYYGLK